MKRFVLLIVRLSHIAHNYLTLADWWQSCSSNQFDHSRMTRYSALMTHLSLLSYWYEVFKWLSFYQILISAKYNLLYVVLQSLHIPTPIIMDLYGIVINSMIAYGCMERFQEQHFFPGKLHWNHVNIALKRLIILQMSSLESFVFLTLLFLTEMI